MKELRKVSNIWKPLEEHRESLSMGKHEYTQSYVGNKAALKSIGIKMVTSKAEFESLPIPIYNGGKHYSRRIIRVSKNGIESSGRIDHFMTGNNALYKRRQKRIKVLMPNLLNQREKLLQIRQNQKPLMI